MLVRKKVIAPYLLFAKLPEAIENAKKFQTSKKERKQQLNNDDDSSHEEES